jgi:hypothetical protein
MYWAGRIGTFKEVMNNTWLSTATYFPGEGAKFSLHVSQLKHSQGRTIGLYQSGVTRPSGIWLRYTFQLDIRCRKLPNRLEQSRKAERVLSKQSDYLSVLTSSICLAQDFIILRIKRFLSMNSELLIIYT